jgi:hypothetical protein
MTYEPRTLANHECLDEYLSRAVQLLVDYQRPQQAGQAVLRKTNLLNCDRIKPALDPLQSLQPMRTEVCNDIKQWTVPVMQRTNDGSFVLLSLFPDAQNTLTQATDASNR